MKNIPIGEVLKNYGYITEEQLTQALAQQKKDPQKRRLGTILIDLGYVTEHQMLTALSQRLQLPVIDLKTSRIQNDVVGRIPKQLAVKYKAIAIGEDGGRLTVAVSDPLNFYAIEDIRQVTKMPLSLVLAETPDIDRAIDYHYAEVQARRAAASANDLAHMFQSTSDEMDDRPDDEAAPVVKLVNSLLLRGYNTNASDIHIEPFEDRTVIRMRIDGMMIEYVTLEATLHAPIIARIKILSGLDIAEKRAPQDGHFRTKLEGVELNIRVSVIPTVGGEKAVLRFLTSNVPIDHAGQFGMEEANYHKLLNMLQSPHGLIYLTGPTGSGKTTTLYMALEYLSGKPVNISTIEDPVERNLRGINQMQVNPLAGVTFENGLRALLRQDPDIIMVGETRDAETASISVRAAITGHLVLSTLHTNDAVSSIIRLRDMGVPPYLLASSLVGLVAQRLVRKVCPHCGYEYVPDEAEQRAAGFHLEKARRGRGCHLCNQTGYMGRIAIHEILHIDQHIREMVVEDAPMSEISRYAREHQHMATLRDSMEQLVRAGQTTLDELLKITYFVE
ncbi:GspE/PulE family protein [Intestinibacillus massiliensis]|uniref:GspE/PulE family protein n=1 Tax=Intestinibacillus massiliensis TaxID=1871029 RepID=UPI000B354E5F|nr:GspE/PulE family protein [Intestinibacillus massiliensis]